MLLLNVKKIAVTTAKPFKLKIMSKKNVNKETGEMISVSPWRTKWNYKGEKQKLTGAKSVTVPGQSLSMKEIITRYQQGRPLVAGQTMFGGYDLDEPLPDLRKMDISEVFELKKQNDKELADIRAEITNREKINKELAEKQAKEKWLEQEIAKREKKKDKPLGSDEEK